LCVTDFALGLLITYLKEPKTEFINPDY